MTEAQAITVESVKVYRMVDTDPDLSWIGEYSNKATSPAAIDREERGDMGRGEFRYFNPCNTSEETGNPESPEQDYQRMESYNRSDWCMIGIQATATIRVNGVAQEINSGGLWGIESDSDSTHLRSVAHEQIRELASILESMGIEGELPEWDGDFTQDR